MLSKKCDAGGRSRGPTTWGCDPEGGCRISNSMVDRREDTLLAASHAVEEVRRRRAEQGPHDVGMRPRRRMPDFKLDGGSSRRHFASRVSCCRRSATPEGGAGAPRRGDATPKADAGFQTRWWIVEKTLC